MAFFMSWKNKGVGLHGVFTLGGCERGETGRHRMSSTWG